MDGIYCFYWIHICNMVSEYPHFLQHFIAQQKIVFSSRRRCKIYSWENSSICNFTIELQFHITCSFKLLKDYIVHFRSRICERGSNNRKRTTIFDITSRSEETLGLL